jgi:hypothetical protein
VIRGQSRKHTCEALLVEVDEAIGQFQVFRHVQYENIRVLGEERRGDKRLR